MSELNLDLSPSTDVTIGGKNYVIGLLSRPMLERILAHVNGEIATEHVKSKKKGEEFTLTEMLFQNFDASLPAIAMILGYEDLDSAAGKEVLEHLRKHLRPAGAIKVFDEFWRLNECDDFFIRGGRCLLHKSVVENLKKAQESVAL